MARVISEDEAAYRRAVMAELSKDEGMVYTVNGDRIGRRKDLRGLGGDRVAQKYGKERQDDFLAELRRRG